MNQLHPQLDPAALTANQPDDIDATPRGG